MSRTETMPATSPPSSTTRWRKPPWAIASAAWSRVQLGAAKTSSDGQMVADFLDVVFLPRSDGGQDVALSQNCRCRSPSGS